MTPHQEAAGGPALVVDVANVMGSRADGWWRDRAGAARRLVEEVGASGLLDQHEVVLVLEGGARASTPAGDGPARVVHAEGSGDEAVVELVRTMAEQGREVTVVTADRELRERVTASGAAVRGPRWLLEQLP